MNAVFAQPTAWQRLKPVLFSFDPWLALAIGLLALIGLVTMYSTGFDHGTRFVDHGRNMVLALAVMLLVSHVPPQRLMALAVPVYTIGVALLIATALFGLSKKGATRWLNIGITTIQPSEISCCCRFSSWFANPIWARRCSSWPLVCTCCSLPA
jgi:rod shape determining protein RodA